MDHVLIRNCRERYYKVHNSQRILQDAALPRFTRHAENEPLRPPGSPKETDS
jgi:hypothetical protein